MCTKSKKKISQQKNMFHSIILREDLIKVDEEDSTHVEDKVNLVEGEKD
jgi:hypothetical protein